MNQCKNCHKNIPAFTEFWLREPDKFDDNGVAIVRGKSLPFCRFECIFGYCASRMHGGKKKQQIKVQHD